MRHLLPGLVVLVVLAAALAPTPTRAEMWCADPLWAHEWGVLVHGAGGATRTSGPALPAYFHGQPGAPSGPVSPVREMPVDGGERALPVLQLYAPRNWRPVPLGLEVGFAEGEASRWFPQLDARRTASDANGPSARAERARLVAAREARRSGAVTSPLGRDPTRQLAWDRLTLDASPAHTLATTATPWVQRLRGLTDALWVNGASESERFVFYEGRTRETPAIRLERGPTHAPGRRHLILRNVSAHPIHDVFLVHREAGAVFVLSAASIPAGRSAGFVLEDHAVAPADLAVRTRHALRDALVDPHESAPPSDYHWGGASGCVMQRDPAIPVERAVDHRLYAAEVDAILEAWGARFFDAQGTTIVHREDTARLDEAMPISLYTDMYHFVVLRRLGLALVEGATLP